MKPHDSLFEVCGLHIFSLGELNEGEWNGFNNSLEWRNKKYVMKFDFVSKSKVKATYIGMEIKKQK